MTRAEALKVGIKKYDGAACEQGHTQRYVSNRKCVACTYTQVMALRAGYTIEAKDRVKRVYVSKHMQIISKQIALKLGLTRYNSGKACSLGHYAEQYVTNNNCVECLTLRHAARRAGHTTVVVRDRLTGRYKAAAAAAAKETGIKGARFIAGRCQSGSL